MTDDHVTLPPLPLHGSCQCGQIRYAISETPLTFYLCHCTNCQHQSSSIAGASLLIRRAALTVKGEPAIARWRADSGAEKSGAFCPSCGVRLFHGSLDSEPDGRITIKAGTLDDTSWLRPAGHIWMSSAIRGLRFPEDDLVYEGQPPDYEKLKARWARMLDLESAGNGQRR
ncbi:GFA family protein [Notoacmeibacter sp. MSK16QG-6]|uniref:GFA family protein n=1 Tax=Notoacmeibacter sp. MSK16QG-6 TaxID=2957982 RepID=UPI00209E74C7|nr:GFA family protein [Notoacmeibacter sp. MSK16QG-6]MCP1200142.1 GFA family protein [Notoacmeibacter sp. MSK16QG-6]